MGAGDRAGASTDVPELGEGAVTGVVVESSLQAASTKARTVVALNARRISGGSEA